MVNVVNMVRVVKVGTVVEVVEVLKMVKVVKVMRVIRPPPKGDCWSVNETASTCRSGVAHCAIMLVSGTAVSLKFWDSINAPT
eukprot:7186145-Karenia_brevis.AAC.1